MSERITTNNLNAIDEGLPFMLTKENKLYFDYYAEDDDGIFESIDDWIKFIKDLDEKGHSNTLSEFYFGKDKKECQWDGFKISLIHGEEAKKTDRLLKIVFDKPTEFVFGTIGNDDEILIKHNITELHCDFDYIPLFNKLKQNSERKHNYCNALEILIENIKFIK